MMKATIFYSWQSDLPTSTNRSFIERALADAIKTIGGDGSLEVEPVLDRDTQGQSGSPNIAETIFRKIDEATVFVADASIIGQAGEGGRSTPNPNVLVELGYALRALGEDRIILVVNTAFGGVELLPFDLRMRRALTYRMALDGQRGDERRNLQRSLESALRATLAAAQPPTVPERTPAELAAGAIEAQATNQVSIVRRYMEWLSEQIANLTPTFEGPDTSGWDDLLVSAINASADFVADTSSLAQLVAEMNADDVARAMYERFSDILKQYRMQGFGGSYYEVEFDLAKFLGHELFVTFIAHLIREERWEVVADLLNRGIFVANPSDGRPRAMPFTEVSQHVRLLEYRNRRLKLNRMSLHADILNRRHSEGRIGDMTPMRDFVAADFFLYLRAAAAAGPTDHGFDWRPWSVLYLKETPPFLHQIALRSEAERLLRPLGVADINALQQLFANRAPQVGKLFGHNGFFWNYPLAELDVGSIGSR